MSELPSSAGLTWVATKRALIEYRCYSKRRLGVMKGVLVHNALAGQAYGDWGVG